MNGKTINGFILQRQLGVGGMAEVWYAKNEIGMAAAVKILSKDLSSNERMKKRFINEAKVMVQLNHPNIRKVLGFGSIDDRPAIIMEYLDGSDLKARMRKGQHFTDEELRIWWNQMVEALDYTHRQNIVHRDIKPSNIFIDQNGDAKLLDFGIAKVVDTSSGTRTGASLGTRIYMSPEQVRDPKRVGAPSDAYSLAVSFLHLISGIAPYDLSKSTDYDIQVSIVTKPIDLSGIPEAWREMLEPYLEKDAEKRPPLRPFVIETKPVAEVQECETDPELTTEDPSTDDDQLTLSPIEAVLKSPKLPWMVAGVACLVALLALLFGGKTEIKFDPEVNNLICVSATNQNVVYIGIDNPIAIGGIGDLTATAEGAKLTKTGNGTYKLRVKGNPDEVVVNVSLRDSLMGSVKFRVMDLPLPKPVIDSVDAEGKCTVENLLSVKGVRAETKDFGLEGVTYEVLGYTVRYRPKEGDNQQWKVKGAKFSGEVKTAIKQAKPGDEFIFSNISVKDVNKKKSTLTTAILVEIK